MVKGNLKVALVHDYIKEYGGAERVLEALHELFPEAPVYTTVYCPEFLGPHKSRFKNWDIRTSWLQQIPYHHKLISIFRLIAPFAFQSFDFSGFDLIITSATGAYSPNILHKKKAKLLSYTHTPPRYLYGYATAREWKSNPFVRVIAEVANHILRVVDFKASQNVDLFIANSENVAGRIKKFYRKKAVVVYPPIEISNFKFQISNKFQNTKYKKRNTGYFLAGGRLARPKHIDLIITVANELGLELKVFGKGFAGYGEELRTLAYGKEHRVNEVSSRAKSRDLIQYSLKSEMDEISPRTPLGRNDKRGQIEFVGEITDEKKLQLMSAAKAFIMASEDEDFGIVPVEAMGMGTPVIAYKSGGLKETVIDGKTGVFFDQLTVGSLSTAIKKFETLEQAQGKRLEINCIAQAKKFSKQEFMRNMLAVISNEVRNPK